MADFNFNLPHRQQAITRMHQQHTRYQHLPRDHSHGCHVFCRECFGRIFLGTAAFKLYLLMAWCAGLAALMVLQSPTKTRETFGVAEKHLAAVTIFILLYLLSQVFGLLAVVTQIEKIFIPYVVVLITIYISFIIMFSIECSRVIMAIFAFSIYDSTRLNEHLKGVLMTSLGLLYHSICLASVVHLCAHFDKKRILALRRRREEIAHNARIYNRLVELNNRDQPVTINVDSPPKYSSLKQRSETVCTPPPGYAQLKNYENMIPDEEKKKSQRSLFSNSTSEKE